MRVHQLEATEAFIAIDLEGAEASSGPVRWARKVLRGGVEDLARSQTYTYAALGMRRGGASAGISAEAADRKAAVAAFVDEIAAMVADGTYLPDAAKGVDETDLASLRGDDPRDSARWSGAPSMALRCEALGAVVAADTAVGLDGRSVVIEAFDESGPTLAAAIGDAGGRIDALATSAGAVRVEPGVTTDELREAFGAHGADMVHHLGGLTACEDLFAVPAEVWFAGSRMGIVDHTVAESLEAAVALVPIGRLAFTARALAVCRRRAVAALPDFVTLAGSTLASWGEHQRTDDDVYAAVRSEIAELVSAAMADDDGPFLGACYRAEAFLQTWQDSLPFGRPLAP